MQFYNAYLYRGVYKSDGVTQIVLLSPFLFIYEAAITENEILLKFSVGVVFCYWEKAVFAGRLFAVWHV